MFVLESLIGLAARGLTFTVGASLGAIVHLTAAVRRKSA